MDVSAKARSAGVSTADKATLNPITLPSVSPGRERTSDSKADLEAAYARNPGNGSWVAKLEMETTRPGAP